MRLIAATTLCLILSPIAGALAADTTPAPASAPAGDTTPAATATSDAAAKHAKRTACRKEATDKKLTGADKKAYVKDCMMK